MDFVSKLTDDEVRLLCESITSSKRIREYFLHYPKEFHRLKPGREAWKLSDHEATEVVINFRGRSFISNFLNGEIDDSLHNVRKEIEKRIEDGDSEQAALLRSLLNSIYKDCPDLYCKLSAENTSPEYRELLSETIKMFRDVQDEKQGQCSNNHLNENRGNDDSRSDLSDRLSEAEEEIFRLRDECKDNLGLLERERLEHQKAIVELQNEADSALQQRDSMRSNLDDAHYKLGVAEQELEIYHRLMERADYPEESRKQDDYPYASLCRVEGLNLYQNGIKLKRLTDVEDGYILPRFDSDFPSRNTLYENYRTDKRTGFIGIWLWKLDYNPASGKLDYVQSVFQQCPAEIKIFPDCNTPSDIKDRLLAGTEFSPTGSKILFSCATGAGEYTGLMCRANELDSIGGIVTLKPSVYDLGLFVFSEHEIVRISGTAFYFRTAVGLPQKRFLVKDPMDVVRDKVLELATSATLKPYGFQKSERKKFQQFLKTLNDANFYLEIATVCGCPIPQAKQYVDDFVLSAEKHLSGEDLNDSVLSAIIAHSSDLLNRCKKSLEEDWNKEYADKIASANRELDKVEHEIKEKSAESIAIDNRNKKAAMEKEKIEAEIKQHQIFLGEVEQNLASRMEEARKNAASFAAEMISLMPFLNPPSKQHPINLSSSTNSVPYYSGTDLDASVINETTDWNAFVDDLQENLILAGISERNDVSDTLSLSFANYLYASILNHVPLMFAGPNGKAIIDAFSCSRFGRTAGVLDCSLPFSHDALEKCVSSTDEVIAVLNPLNASWIEHISDMISIPGKYVFAVQPFAEDLMVEPKGLYNYFLPVLTELLIDNSPKSSLYTGGFCGRDYKEWTRQSAPNKIFKTARFLGVSEFNQVRMNNLFYDFYKIDESTGMDVICLFSLFPYAYLTGQSKKLLDLDSLAISDKTRKYLRAYLGDVE